MVRGFTTVELTGHVPAEHNAKDEYNNGGQQLSFEFKRAREAGLPYDVAQKISEYGSGLAAIVNPLIASGAKNTTELETYIKAINCWGDGTKNSIADALANRFMK